jgi:hypothetical protein
MKRLAVLAAAFASLPVSAATIEVASGDWSNIPEMTYKGYPRVPLEAALHIQHSLASGECNVPGQTKNKFDLSVPFLVRFEPGGAVDKLVLQRVGCDRIESVAGQMALKIVQAGGYRPSKQKNATGWYRGTIRFRAPGNAKAQDMSF